MDPIVETILNAAAVGRLEEVKLLLHPYLRWADADGSTRRGRTNVLRHLGSEGALAPPARVELRDGQIYRWWST